jgi:hypothetical protein
MLEGMGLDDPGAVLRDTADAFRGVHAASIHPVPSHDELRSAISQIVNRVETSGTTDSGGTFVLGVPCDGQPD